MVVSDTNELGLLSGVLQEDELRIQIEYNTSGVIARKREWQFRSGSQAAT
jgi:hypothetical protein